MALPGEYDRLNDLIVEAMGLDQPVKCQLQQDEALNSLRIG